MYFAVQKDIGYEENHLRCCLFGTVVFKLCQ